MQTLRGNGCQSTVDPSKSAPAILVVPTDTYVPGADFLPPGFELFARNIKGRRCDQMIEDDGMLFAPVEAGNKVQILIVERMARDCSSDRTAVHWAIEEFRCGIQKAV